jgi:hypothetical protein
MPAVERLLTLRYRCRECPQCFGDPEAERDFDTWSMAVKIHMLERHEKVPYYLNDMLKPIWEHVKFVLDDRSGACDTIPR